MFPMSMPFHRRSRRRAGPAAEQPPAANPPRSSATRRFPTPLTAVLALLALVFTTTLGTLALSTLTSQPAEALTGTPVYTDTFSNQSSAGGAIDIRDYPGSNGSYTADPDYTPSPKTYMQCNGWVMSAVTPQPADAGCVPNNAWAFLKDMSRALGLFQGQSDAESYNNQALTEYTNSQACTFLPNSCVTPGYEFVTQNNIPAIAGHSYAVSAIFAEVNCGVGVAGSLTFSLVVNGVEQVLATGLNPCTAPGGQTYLGVRVVELQSPAILMETNGTLGLRLYNAQPSGNGNDVAFDLPQIIEVPTVSEPAQIKLNKALGSDRYAASDQFTVAIRTGSASGPVVSNTANSTTAGSGPTVTAGSGTTGTYAATSGIAYYLTESGVGTTQPGNYTASLSCTDANGIQQGLPNGPFTGSMVIVPVPGANISCTITNTAKPRTTINLAKGEGDASGPDANGNYTATYYVTVRNSGSFPGIYSSLVDTPAFSPNLVPTGVSWTGQATGSQTGAGPYTILDNTPTPIPAGATHMYIVTITFHFTNTAPATDCAGAGTGLYNSASVGGETGPATDNAACDLPPLIPGEWEIAKSAKVNGATPATNLVKGGDVITYTVTATGLLSTVTDAVLMDTLADVLDDATFVAGSAMLTVGAAAPVPVDDPVAPENMLMTPGFTLAEGEVATLTYQVTVKPDVWNKELVNVATGYGSSPPNTCDADVTPVGPECMTTHITPAKVLIEKIGESGSSTWVPMDGSSWSVRVDNGGQPGAVYSGAAVTAVVPNAVGQFELSNIPVGTYWLTETAAPDGFSLLAEPVQFTIAANGAVTLGEGSGSGVVTTADGDADGIFTITVRDVPALTMPEAGGSGSTPFTVAGALLLFAAAVIAVRFRRRPGRTREAV